MKISTLGILRDPCISCRSKAPLPPDPGGPHHPLHRTPVAALISNIVYFKNSYKTALRNTISNKHLKN